jgi:hypothetical protein
VEVSRRLRTVALSAHVMSATLVSASKAATSMEQSPFSTGSTSAREIDAHQTRRSSQSYRRVQIYDCAETGHWQHIGARCSQRVDRDFCVKSMPHQFVRPSKSLRRLVPRGGRYMVAGESPLMRLKTLQYADNPVQGLRVEISLNLRWLQWRALPGFRSCRRRMAAPNSDSRLWNAPL